MMDVILMVLTFLVLAIASATDLRWREVPDWLNYGFLFSALGIRAIYALSDWTIIVSGLLGFVALFVLGYLFYVTGQWGGGDSKLLMGMGAAIGIGIPLTANSLSLAWYFISLLLLGAVYGLGWMAFLALRKEGVGKVFKQKVASMKVVHFTLIGISVVLVGLALTTSGFWQLLLFPLPLFYLFLFVTSVEETCFIRNASTSKLTEGDWLAEDVKRGNFSMTRRTLAKEDIKKLRRAVKHVKIKDGIPFVPSFLLGYILFVFAEPLIRLIM
jgi:Flp pilus assembly protein protease CpaA